MRKYHKLCVIVSLGYPNWMEVDLLHHFRRWIWVEWASYGVSRPILDAELVEFFYSNNSIIGGLMRYAPKTTRSALWLLEA